MSPDDITDLFAYSLDRQGRHLHIKTCQVKKEDSFEDVGILPE